MLNLDDVDYKDTKLIELETFINTPFDDQAEVQSVDSVWLRVYRDGKQIHEEQFQEDSEGKYYVNWHTHELPDPDTYKVEIEAQYGDDKMIREGYVRVLPSGDQT